MSLSQLPSTYRHKFDEHFLAYLRAIETNMMNCQKILRTTPTLMISEDRNVYTIRWDNGDLLREFDHKIEFEVGKHFTQEVHGTSASEVDTVFEVVDDRLIERQDHGKIQVTVDYELHGDRRDLRLVYWAGNVKGVHQFH